LAAINFWDDNPDSFRWIEPRVLGVFEDVFPFSSCATSIKIDIQGQADWNLTNDRNLHAVRERTCDWDRPTELQKAKKQRHPHIAIFFPGQHEHEIRTPMNGVIWYDWAILDN